MCAAHINNFSSSLVERVGFSDSRVVYKFILINNIALKCSFVWCRKYHKSWSNGAAELHILVDLLCGTTAAELQNSVNLLCGTTAAELNPVWCMHQESQIFRRQWRTMLKNMKASSKVKFNSKLLKDERFGRFSNHRSMYALRRFSKLFKRWTLYEDRISDLSNPLKDERRGHTNHHELAHQSEAKRKQTPQSGKTSLINCTGYPIMHTQHKLGVVRRVVCGKWIAKMCCANL